MSVAYDWTDGADLFRRLVACEIYCTQIKFPGLQHVDGDRQAAIHTKLEQKRPVEQ